MFSSQKLHFCVKCNSPAELMCGRCNDSYCSNECQISDWMEHKLVCKTMPKLVKISATHSSTGAIPKSGKVLVANFNNIEQRTAQVESTAERNTAQPSRSAALQRDELKETDSFELQRKAKNTFLSFPEVDRLPSEKLQSSAQSSSGSEIETVVDDDKSNVESATGDSPSKELHKQVKFTKSIEIQTKEEDYLPNKVHLFSDVKVIPLRRGNRIPLTIVDTTFLDQYVINAMEYECKGRAQMNKNLKKLAEYCHVAARTSSGYEPSLNEMCLAIYDADGEWYRAYLFEEKGEGDEYMVQFIDFGNILKVPRSHIMPITEELMFDTYVNVCRITNLEEKDIPKFRNYVNNNPFIFGDVSYVDNLDIYHVNVKNLEKILK